MLSDYRYARAKEIVRHFAGEPERNKLKRKVTVTTINRELVLLRSALSELLRLHWSEVDFSNRLIHFLKTKNKHPREVPILDGFMLDSLQEAFRLHEAAWPDEQAVFVYDGHRMATVGNPWDKACTRAGFWELMLHDLHVGG